MVKLLVSGRDRGLKVTEKVKRSGKERRKGVIRSQVMEEVKLEDEK